MPTIKITGVDEPTARFVSERAKERHFPSTSEYLRDLVRQDRTRAEAERRTRLADILAPLHAHSEAEGYTDEEIAEAFAHARKEVASKRKPPTSRTAEGRDAATR